MARELKDLVVEWISLVKRPANGRALVLRDGRQPRKLRLTKLDEEMMRAYGIVYAPDEVDSQGDYASADTILAAANQFMREGRSRNVDKHHSFAESGHYIAESWIVRDGDPLFPNERPGAWAVGIQVTDPAEWRGVKSAEVGGLSLAGSASSGSESEQKGHSVGTAGPESEQKGQSQKSDNGQKGQSDNQQGQSDDAPGWFRRLFARAASDEADMTKDEMTAVVATAAKSAVADALAGLTAAAPLVSEPAAKGDDGAALAKALSEALAPLTARLDALKAEVDALGGTVAARGASETGPGGADDDEQGWL